MVAEINNGNGAITKSEPIVLRGPDGRWLPGTPSPAAGRRRDPAERIRQRILDALEGAKGAESLESVLSEVARTKPADYIRFVISVIAPAKAATKGKPGNGLTLDALLADLERRDAATAERDAKLIDSDAADEPDDDLPAE